MALLFNIPYSDNLQCSNVVCEEKATRIVHLKNDTKILFCDAHLPDLDNNHSVARTEKLRTAGEYNK